MIKALLLDLGGTLIVGGAALPGVPEALSALQSFETAEGKPLIMCLVSDYTMPDPPTSQAIEHTFNQYLEILDKVGLRNFFEPVNQRVTISTQVGVNKPDKLIFESALNRAKVNASIKEALFITEDTEHIKACLDLGMTVIQFGTDFTDWVNAPLLVAQTIAPSNLNNLFVALKLLLAKRHEVELLSIDSIRDGVLKARARSLVKLEAPQLGSLNGIYVELPTVIDANITRGGLLADVRIIPNPEDIAEAVRNVQTLASNRQVSEGRAEVGSSPVLPTHSVETDGKGRRVLRRRRFTAW